MPRLLAIDTTSKTASVALFENFQLIEEIVLPINTHTHSEKLLPAIDQLLRKNGGPLQSQDLLGVSIGPGSFTSLRVGLATTMALAQPLDLPVYAISSLLLQAGPFLKKDEDVVVSTLKAGRGKFYAAVFQKNSSIHTLVPEFVSTDWNFLQPSQIVVGSALELLPVSKYNAADFSLMDPMAVPLASSIGDLISFQSLKPKSWNALALNYIQPPDIG